jgi:hypothetical protein
MHAIQHYKAVDFSCTACKHYGKADSRKKRDKIKSLLLKYTAERIHIMIYTKLRP